MPSTFKLKKKSTSSQLSNQFHRECPPWEATSCSASQGVIRSCGSGKYVNVFSRAHHVSLFWASWIQSYPKTLFLSDSL